MKPIAEMTTEEKNREVAEWLGYVWNNDIPMVCPMSLEVDCVQCSVDSCPAKRPNPDFTTDSGKIQLLRGLPQKVSISLAEKKPKLGDEICIPLYYLADTTGKLLDSVLEWKRRNDGN